jgi:hypothetical protein
MYPPIVLFFCILVCLLWGGYLLTPVQRTIPVNAIQFKDLEFLDSSETKS